MSDTLSSRAAAGEPASGRPASAKVAHRPAWIAFVVVGAIFCLGMGFWQLSAYQAASGTVQNLGYTFMWPFLAGFLVYAYLKYIRLEADERETDPDAGDRGPVDGDDDEVGDQPDGPRTARTARTRAPVVTEIPADLLPTRRPPADTRARDEGLDAYNAYLAELARHDRAATVKSESGTSESGTPDNPQERPAT
ncbi:hypothetical protein [Rhodococcus sp. IEGM 1408]|uniref:hypothetical protein n=1 Tax=Rhodococcus sp. IEGM 1408 TaxID=3082220 RepID=UPI002952E62C|nr:hypothetical protein [Rhodococcus sp. IEGM 1408]MDV8000801.1 hypothetical protein [Rhodococcus sp. IEGM 1408]